LPPRNGAPLRKHLPPARSASGSTSMTYIEAPDEQSVTAAEKSLERDESSDFSLVEAVAERSELQNQLYLRYRRPLLQVFHHRRIDRHAADDLLQRTFLQAIKKIRTEGLDDPGNLGGYLYRTACKLATAYWRGELSRRHENDRELLTNLKDEALSLEERLDHEQLAKHVRDLMDHLPVQRDREVLERFYLHEEPRTAIRESLQLTDMQFNQVLWRARQRFGDILRKAGLALGDPGAGPSSSAHSTHG
jgi:RNA polymerase sigma-70 factor, ECF subfamily